MSMSAIQATEQTTTSKPVSRLAALYGITPAPRLSDTAAATLTTEQGTTTSSLPVRQDPDCPRRTQVQTPCKCHEWEVLYWNEYAGVFSPIYCYNCNIAIDVCPQQPIASTSELAVEETTTPQEAKVEPVTIEETVLATFSQIMDVNGCCEHEDLVQASGLDSLKVKQAIRFLNDAGERIVWMRSEFPYWQWQNARKAA